MAARRGHGSSVLLAVTVASMLFIAAEASERALSMAISPNGPSVSKDPFQSENDAANVG
jgi:hypothetical protein